VGDVSTEPSNVVYHQWPNSPDVPAEEAANRARESLDEIDENIWNLAVRWCMGDRSTFDEIEEADADLMLEYVRLIDMEMYEDSQEEYHAPGEELDSGLPAPPWSSGLPNCNYYWGNYRTDRFALYQRGPSGYNYYWSPNCYMSASTSHCGGGSNNMVSFWMGPDYTTSWNSYNVDGTTPSIDLYMMLTSDYRLRYGESVVHDNVRLYTSGGHGNAYVCLPKSYKPDNLRFGH
jgi:hypothetical protein